MSVPINTSARRTLYRISTAGLHVKTTQSLRPVAMTTVPDDLPYLSRIMSCAVSSFHFHRYASQCRYCPRHRYRFVIVSVAMATLDAVACAITQHCWSTMSVMLQLALFQLRNLVPAGSTLNSFILEVKHTTNFNYQRVYTLSPQLWPNRGLYF